MFEPGFNIVFVIDKEVCDKTHSWGIRNAHTYCYTWELFRCYIVIEYPGVVSGKREFKYGAINRYTSFMLHIVSMGVTSNGGREILSLYVGFGVFTCHWEVGVGLCIYVSHTLLVYPARTGRTESTLQCYHIGCEVCYRFGCPVTFFIITGSTQIDVRIQFFGRFECDAVDVVGDVGVSMEYDVSNPPG